jgi:hypothetical protein
MTVAIERICSAKAPFHKAVLYYDRHNGFPCHGIHDIAFSYVFCINILVYFSQQKMYFIPLDTGFVQYDTLVQWLHLTGGVWQ